MQRKAYAIEENRVPYTPEHMLTDGSEKEQPVFANSFPAELAILMHREWLTFCRSPSIFIIRVVLAVCALCYQSSSKLHNHLETSHFRVALETSLEYVAH